MASITSVHSDSPALSDECLFGDAVTSSSKKKNIDSRIQKVKASYSINEGDEPSESKPTGKQKIQAKQVFQEERPVSSRSSEKDASDEELTEKEKIVAQVKKLIPQIKNNSLSKQKAAEKCKIALNTFSNIMNRLEKGENPLVRRKAQKITNDKVKKAKDLIIETEDKPLTHEQSGQKIGLSTYGFKKIKSALENGKNPIKPQKISLAQKIREAAKKQLKQLFHQIKNKKLSPESAADRCQISKTMYDTIFQELENENAAAQLQLISESQATNKQTDDDMAAALVAKKQREEADTARLLAAKEKNDALAAEKAAKKQKKEAQAARIKAIKEKRAAEAETKAAKKKQEEAVAAALAAEKEKIEAAAKALAAEKQKKEVQAAARAAEKLNAEANAMLIAFNKKKQQIATARKEREKAEAATRAAEQEKIAAAAVTAATKKQNNLTATIKKAELAIQALLTKKDTVKAEIKALALKKVEEQIEVDALLAKKMEETNEIESLKSKKMKERMQVTNLTVKKHQTEASLQEAQEEQEKAEAALLLSKQEKIELDEEVHEATKEKDALNNELLLTQRVKGQLEAQAEAVKNEIYSINSWKGFIESETEAARNIILQANAAQRTLIVQRNAFAAQTAQAQAVIDQAAAIQRSALQTGTSSAHTMPTPDAPVSGSIVFPSTMAGRAQFHAFTDQVPISLADLLAAQNARSQFVVEQQPVPPRSGAVPASTTDLAWLDNVLS